jgi:hypothetical protein
MEKWKSRTALVTLSIPVIIIIIFIYDAIAIHYGGTEASISSYIITSSYKMPFMTFMIGNVIGILEGHLFWRMRTNKDTKEIDLKK